MLRDPNATPASKANSAAPAKKISPGGASAPQPLEHTAGHPDLPSFISLEKEAYFLAESFTYKKHGSKSNSSLLHIEYAES